MCTMVPTLRQAMGVTPTLSISLSLPAATSTPSTSATTPPPLTSRMFFTRLRSISRPQARRMLLLMGWLDALSASAAYSSRRSLSMVL